MINSIASGKYLLRYLGSNYYIKKIFGVYRVYHNKLGYIATANTQKECRNYIRTHLTQGA